MGLNTGSRLRAGITLIARGEFSLVIAMMGLAAGLNPELGTLSAAYVLFTAVVGPLLLRVSEPLLARYTKVAPGPQFCEIGAERTWAHHGSHSKSA
jgi:monovalent cation:H+ antiporter-2, CPA2 family